MKRIVIKVGSGVLTENNTIARERMLNLVSLVAKLQEKNEVILVSSGAVASGYTALKLDRKKHIGKKALASIGQPILMSSYKRKFEIFDIDTSQSPFNSSIAIVTFPTASLYSLYASASALVAK